MCNEIFCLAFVFVVDILFPFSLLPCFFFFIISLRLVQIVNMLFDNYFMLVLHGQKDVSIYRHIQTHYTNTHVYKFREIIFRNKIRWFEIRICFLTHTNIYGYCYEFTLRNGSDFTLNKTVFFFCVLRLEFILLTSFS